MPRWSSQRIWKRISGQLAVTVDREFERAVFPYLRVIYPSLQRVPSKGSWDRKGIDLLARVDKLTKEDYGEFDCVIQCKGYEVNELGYDQIYKARESINDFRNSGLRANTYLLVHNRDGRSRDFHEKICHELSELVQSGIVKTAELWDRQQLLDKVFDKIKEQLDRSLRDRAISILERFQKLFDFTIPYVSVVPVTESKLIFERYKPCQLKVIETRSLQNVKSLLLSPSDARWTLFVGTFGAGKTTAALHTAISSDTIPIFAQAAELTTSNLCSGTNALLEEIIKSLDVLEGFKEEDLPIIEEIAGGVLAYLLRYRESGYLLIMDGLDENRAYCDLKGLQYLSNQIAEFSCPVILTTRKEHLSEMFGNFSEAFYEFSTKYGPSRSARLLELERWENSNIIYVVESLLQDANVKNKSQLQDFLKLMQTGEFREIYGELPYNPLFLSFILDDIFTDGIKETNRVNLLRSWVDRKIRRDRQTVLRVGFSDSLDIEEFVGRMLLLLEDVAYEMTTQVLYGFELAEVIDSDLLKLKAENIFRSSPDSILSILLNSVLVPQGFRKGIRLNIMFAFRVLQEYFLASFLARENLDVNGYPKSIVNFYNEIKENEE